MNATRERVREFYDEVGWTSDAAGLFQNARFEDLRPVSSEYIHRCHMRVNRHLHSPGELLLDAGSGPVQWAEYLTYSSGYRHRVCVDLSVTALKAARGKLDEHGLYVVADIASLPFPAGAFDGVVSMHAIHHLPSSQHGRAYRELLRTLRAGRSGVTVDGWYRPLLMRLAEPLIGLGRALTGRRKKTRKRDRKEEAREVTFVEKLTPRRLRNELGDTFLYDVFPWRSLSPRFMQWFVRDGIGGRAFLRMIFMLEERFPRFFGLHGQYPMIVFRKPVSSEQSNPWAPVEPIAGTAK